MPEITDKFKQTPTEQIYNLPDDVLFSLARNESASKEYRKAAVQLLLENNSRYTKHIELRELVLEIKAEHEAKKEVSAIVSSAVEDHTGQPASVVPTNYGQPAPKTYEEFARTISPLKIEESDNVPCSVEEEYVELINTVGKDCYETGPFKASVTTKSLNEEG